MVLLYPHTYCVPKKWSKKCQNVLNKCELVITTTDYTCCFSNILTYYCLKNDGKRCFHNFA